PIAGRTRLETEPLIGFFVNTLVLRTDLSGEPTFGELVGRVRETTLGAYAHQEIPFERLVEELAPERSLAHTPLFQAMLVLQNEERGGLRMGEVEMETLAAGGGEIAKFDLTLGLVEDEWGVRGSLSYRAELWDRATMERMAEHFARLLEGAVRSPSVPVGELPLLGVEERARVVEGWNATDVAFPAAAVPLHRLVEAQAARTPEAVAVVFEEEALTYGELDARAGRLAVRLRGLGVGAETRVAVCAERSTELVVALLGVLKAGAAYVPVDPEYPAERVAYMLDDSAAPVLLTQGRLCGRLPEFAGEVVLLDGGEVGAAEPTSTALPAESAETLAYVIYTSGSTGRPKGAMNTHRGIVNRLLWMQAEYGLTREDVVLQKTPFSFDVSVWELFWPLMVGARLVVARPGGHREPEYLREVIEREGVTTLHFVPPMLEEFLEGGKASRCASVRRVVCSGEALPYALVERFSVALPGAELHNLYGPTEAAVDVTYHACGGEQDRVVPIGRAVANTRVYVLDGALEPAPVGVAGELYIGGVQVGRGYLGRADLTAERFVPAELGGGVGARLYRTGDRARWRASGEVEYLGRRDFQVKVRGFRIETGEIEAVLREEARVREAVVVAREDAPGEVRLVAYVVARGEVPEGELRARLRERLPEHMVPGALVVLEELPLTGNGKVDRRALPAPEWTSGEAYVAPRTPVEEVLAGIWGDVLGAERVGAGDDF
ncbi:MAG TPA: amino acid adenylation domain-containing protein, partial [Longimicrobiaceae bacterium]